MADDSYTFAQTRARLDDIVTQVRKKDTSLEKSLDLLEEGVRLANQCTELIDHADWDAAAGTPDGQAIESPDSVEAAAAEEPADGAPEATPEPEIQDEDAPGASGS